METINIKEHIIPAISYSKLEDYSLLVKFKLTITVVLTSLLGYLVASQGQINWIGFVWLMLGGFLVTASANAINEVLEKDYDILMSRTAIRPLAAGRMKVSEAVLFAGIALLLGVSILAMFNPVTALFGMISFVLYAFIYTPLKRYSTMAVSIGAIPGALPVLLGCTAVEGKITLLALLLFIIQFLWQFPHFWSIGYLGFSEYKKAGYKLLPVNDEGEVDRNIGLHAFIYASLIIPAIGYMYYLGYLGMPGLIVCLLAVIAYAYFAFRFHRSFDRPSALALMFSSFFFMPLILITCLIF